MVELSTKKLWRVFIYDFIKITFGRWGGFAAELGISLKLSWTTMNTSNMRLIGSLMSLNVKYEKIMHISKHIFAIFSKKTTKIPLDDYENKSLAKNPRQTDKSLTSASLLLVALPMSHWTKAGFCPIPSIILSCNLFNTRGTEGNTVGLSCAMSSNSSFMLPWVQ